MFLKGGDISEGVLTNVFVSPLGMIGH